jgi:hypothetical protein
MTSHAPPRLSSHPSNQPWRKSRRKTQGKTHLLYLSSLSSTLKMGSTRGWLASTPRDTIPMHHHQRSSSGTTEWKGSPQQRGFLTHLRRAIRNTLRSSYALTNFTSISRRASGLSVRRFGRRVFDELRPSGPVRHPILDVLQLTTGCATCTAAHRRRRPPFCRIIPIHRLMSPLSIGVGFFSSCCRRTDVRQSMGTMGW